MPAVENINGQAITLHAKHKGVKTAAEMKGFKFGVPFDYSMHNFLLRYVLAESTAMRCGSGATSSSATGRGVLTIDAKFLHYKEY
jgi:hypothetical protein